MAGNEQPESEDFHLGKMVGEVMGRIAEQERISDLLDDIQVSIYDEKTQQIKFIEMDWSDLKREIRGE